MTLIEVVVPKGRLTERDRVQLSERLTTRVMSGDGVPADILERGRGLTWVVVHEPTLFAIAGRPVLEQEQPLLVRVTVPAGHLNDSLRAELVARVTRVVADVTGSDRFYAEPEAWVQILELPDRSLGLFGLALPTSDIISLVVDSEHHDRLLRQHGASAHDSLIDPVCGMTVPPTDSAILVERGGKTYGFCSEVCRRIADAAPDVYYGVRSD